MHGPRGVVCDRNPDGSRSVLEQADQLVGVFVECERGFFAMREPPIAGIGDVLRRDRHELDREHRLPTRTERAQEGPCVDPGGGFGLA